MASNGSTICPVHGLQCPDNVERKEKVFRKRKILLALSIILTISVAGVGGAAALGLFHTQTTGHIHVVNGTTPGISVNPAFLDFGDVIWGSTVSKNMTVTNTGNCIENVNATASQVLQTPVLAMIQGLAPNHSQIVVATYDTSVFGTAGDYNFTIDWFAACQ